ncbi:MAG: response regulator transcription factor [Eubacterium sp.]|nr:response regulator transcription factor [Eubacterium sp.]
MRVLIVDDDNLVALSLKTILETDRQIEVAGIGNNGPDAIALYDQLSPDILLLDIRMDGMSGLEAGTQILNRHPGAKILFLTTFSDDEYIIRSLHIGAKGYILKQNFESILPALAAVENGQTVFGDEITARLPDLMKHTPSTSSPVFSQYHITEKEMMIIHKVAEGLNNREIAEALFLSEGTVRNYLSIILEKLGLRDRTQLAIFYFHHS